MTIPTEHFKLQKHKTYLCKWRSYIFTARPQPITLHMNHNQKSMLEYSKVKRSKARLAKQILKTHIKKPSDGDQMPIASGESLAKQTAVLRIV